MSPKRARQVPGLAPDRADIIVAGLAVVDRIMRRFKVNLLQVHNRGVRDGLLLTMIDQSLGAASDDPHDREAAVDRFAAGVRRRAGARPARGAAGRSDLFATGRAVRHGPGRPLVARSRGPAAGRGLPDQLRPAPQAQLSPDPEQPPAGFSPARAGAVANIARYHRGATPKKKHDNFRSLEPRTKSACGDLAAILRIAGGLDRSHTQQVQDVTVRAGAAARSWSRSRFLRTRARTPRLTCGARGGAWKCSSRFLVVTWPWSGRG